MKVIAICALIGALFGSGLAYTQVASAEKNDSADTKPAYRPVIRSRIST